MRLNEIFGDMFNRADYGVALIDSAEPGWPVIYCNDVFRCMAGGNGHEGTCQPGTPWDAFLERHRIPLSPDSMKTVKQGDTCDVEEYLFKIPQGDRRRLVLHAQFGDETRTEEIYRIAFLYPDSDAGDSQDLEVHRNRLQNLGYLSAGVAHDFNNVLAIIDGYLQMVQSAYRDCLPGDAREMLDRTAQAVQRGAGLTHKLLSYSRAEFTSNNGYCLQNLLCEQGDLFRMLVSPNVDLAIDIPQKALRVQCNTELISQVLMNLIVNANQAISEKGGAITLRVFETDKSDLPLSAARTTGFAQIQVEDNGPGIPQEDMDKIFEPFFTTKADKGGTGLGLSVVKGVVEQIGGTIHCHSVPGKGACFKLFIPLSGSCKAANETSPAVQDAEALMGRSVLLVEDESDLRRVMHHILEDMGLQVAAASNAQEALEFLASQACKPDYLLTDLVMPGMNGHMLVLQAEKLSPATVSVVMSGYPSDDEISHFPVPGHIPLLRKPVQPETLRRTLAEHDPRAKQRKAQAGTRETVFNLQQPHDVVRTAADIGQFNVRNLNKGSSER